MIVGRHGEEILEAARFGIATTTSTSERIHVLGTMFYRLSRVESCKLKALGLRLAGVALRKLGRLPDDYYDVV